MVRAVAVAYIATAPADATLGQMADNWICWSQAAWSVGHWNRAVLGYRVAELLREMGGAK